MSRPQSKSELLKASENNYGALCELVDGLSSQQLRGNFPFSHRDKNVRDVLAHLHEWHLMLLRWYKIGMADGDPVMPAEGFTWKTTPALNQEIWSKYQAVSLKRVRSKLDQSHQQLQELIGEQPTAELFEKRRYKWTGSTSLGSYLTSATASHYLWAMKLIRKYKRSIDTYD